MINRDFSFFGEHGEVVFTHHFDEEHTAMYLQAVADLGTQMGINEHDAKRALNHMLGTAVWTALSKSYGKEER